MYQKLEENENVYSDVSNIHYPTYKGRKPNQDLLKNDLKLLAGITAFDEYLKKG